MGADKSRSLRETRTLLFWLEHYKDIPIGNHNENNNNNERTNNNTNNNNDDDDVFINESEADRCASGRNNHGNLKKIRLFWRMKNKFVK